MTCIVREFGCSCAAHQCQTPHYEILEQSMTTARGRIIIAVIAMFVMVASFTYAGFQIKNAITLAEIEERV